MSKKASVTTPSIVGSVEATRCSRYVRSVPLDLDELEPRHPMCRVQRVPLLALVVRRYVDGIEDRDERHIGRHFLLDLDQNARAFARVDGPALRLDHIVDGAVEGMVAAGRKAGRVKLLGQELVRVEPRRAADRDI